MSEQTNSYVASGGPIDGRVITVNHRDLGEFARYRHCETVGRRFQVYEYLSMVVDGVKSLVYVGLVESITNTIPDNYAPSILKMLESGSTYTTHFKCQT